MTSDQMIGDLLITTSVTPVSSYLPCEKYSHFYPAYANHSSQFLILPGTHYYMHTKAE